MEDRRWALLLALLRWWRQRHQRPGRHERPDHHRRGRRDEDEDG